MSLPEEGGTWALRAPEVREGREPQGPRQEGTCRNRWVGVGEPENLVPGALALGGSFHAPGIQWTFVSNMAVGQPRGRDGPAEPPEPTPGFPWSPG